MKVQQAEQGGVCESIAGRDKGRLYLIVRLEGDTLYLADGKYRTAENPKVKNRRHVRLMPLFRREIAERIAQGKDENSNIHALLLHLEQEQKNGNKNTAIANGCAK